MVHFMLQPTHNCFRKACFISPTYSPLPPRCQDLQIWPKWKHKAHPRVAFSLFFEQFCAEVGSCEELQNNKLQDVLWEWRHSKGDLENDEAVITLWRGYGPEGKWSVRGSTRSSYRKVYCDLTTEHKSSATLCQDWAERKLQPFRSFHFHFLRTINKEIKTFSIWDISPEKYDVFFLYRWKISFFKTWTSL